MSKVIIFSRVFPCYHPNAGQPTYFVEKILNWFWDQPENSFHNVLDLFLELNGGKINSVQLNEWIINNLVTDVSEYKNHTIRLGHRWKVGDKFSPRVWSGQPYKSKQIIIAPDIEIKKIWNIEIAYTIQGIKIIGKWDFDGFIKVANNIASNDGLSEMDFENWITKSPEFKKKGSFIGQIICWNENIGY